MTGIRAVLFDLGGVLIDWNPRHLYRGLFRDEAAMESFLAEVCHSQWNGEIDAGKSFREAVWQRQREVPEYAEFIGFWWSRWEEMLGGPITGTVAILQELKAADFPIYALTNWSRETFPTARRLFPFLEWFRDIVVSGEERVAKPDPAIFQVAIRRCGLVPAETAFIDDSRTNVEAARALGFDGIQFTGPESLRVALAQRGLVGAGDGQWR